MLVYAYFLSFSFFVGHGIAQDSEMDFEDLNTESNNSSQQKLFAKLFKSYNRDIRPITRHDEVLHIYLTLSLYNVITLASRTGQMISNIAVILQWSDPYLTWDPARYGGMRVMRVPHDLVWIPDIVLHNIAEKDYEASLMRTNIIITFGGQMKLMTHGIFTSHCNIDIEWYPFDEQVCKLSFSSWTFDRQQIVLHPREPDLSRYHYNHEFYLENFYVKQLETKDICCEEPFSTLIYYIQLQRRMKFAFFFFIVPGILINICALLVFALPVESGEKIGLGINSILAMIVFLMEMISNLPPEETIPLAGVYYGSCMVIITLNVFFTVFVLNISFTGFRGIEVPDRIRKLALLLAAKLKVAIPAEVEQKWIREINLVPKKKKFKSKSDDLQFFNGWTHDRMIQETSITKPTFQGGNDLKDPFQRRTMEVLAYVQEYLDSQKRRIDDKTYQAIRVQEWKFLSRIIDRILLMVFVFSAITFNSILLMMSPHSSVFSFCPEGHGNCESWTEEERTGGKHF